jgi:hypothetical protein
VIKNSPDLDRRTVLFYTSMAVWRMLRMVDLPWQSTNKRSLKIVMFRNITGLFGSTGSAIEFTGMLYQSYIIILWF